MWYRTGAELVVIVHLLFISFIVGGVFLTWRWPVIIWAHIPAVIYGVLIEFAGFICPLTLLENGLRQRAGDAGYQDGFISHYLIKVIYPPGLTHGMQIGLGVVLLLVAIIGYSGFLRQHGHEHLGQGRRTRTTASSSARRSRPASPTQTWETGRSPGGPWGTTALVTCRYRITPANNDQPASAADASCS